ncbi:gliding motility-associated C-terminal domain-containing protein [Adhaeribacter aquaticus]|uniref:Ig-like domain-containing protein n=1 Tax=Adhaeribacter aquaticus TaxID=299567 RepID=UPI00047A4887|nr:gliding motility-associated C-terminal domain-containing protein [Adhaeribacter aquaticus]
MNCQFQRLVIGLLLPILLVIGLPQAYAQNCSADATLIDAYPNDPDKPFVNCTSFSEPSYTLQVLNGSQTMETNQSYTIEWGDGTVNTFDKTFHKFTHEYKALGTFSLKFTVKGADGCSTTKAYNVYNGSFPALTVGTPGNTLDCAPATFTFPISGTQNNSLSTVYIFQFDDGTPPLIFSHKDLPSSITHVFTKASKDKPNGYTLTATATNACLSSTVTAGPIRISSGPVADFIMDPENQTCENTLVRLFDKSNAGYNAGSTNPNNADYIRKWEISSNTGWSFAEGTNETSANPVILFSKAGDYSITLMVSPRNANTRCKSDGTTKDIKILAKPVADFSTLLNPIGGCAPAKLSILDKSTGDAISYQWKITPASGFTITSGSLTSANPVFDFTQAGDYVLSLTVTNICGTSTKETNVKIKDLPTVTLPAAQAYCGPQTILFDSSNPLHSPVYNLNNTSNVSYHWEIKGPDKGASYVNSNNSSPFPEIAFSKPGTYTVSVSIVNECGTSVKAEQEIQIKEIPAAPIVKGALICANTTTTLTTSSPGEIEWFSTLTGGTPLATGTTFTTPIITEQTVYYIQTTVNGCTSPRNEVVIKVTPAITNNSISAAQTICSGLTPNKILGSEPAGGNGAFTYLWEYSHDNITFSPAPGANKDKDYQPGALTQKTYFRRQVSSLPCGNISSNTIEIEVNPLPEVASVSSVTVCLNGTATLTPKPLAGVSFNWYSTETGTSALATGASFTTPALTKTNTYYVESISSNGCVNPQRTAVTVTVLPEITNNTISSSQQICSGEVANTLSGTNPVGGAGVYTYLWESSQDGVSFAPAAGNNQNPTYQPGAVTHTTIYRRKVVSQDCFNYSNTIEIKVNPLSLAPELDGITVCAGQPAHLVVKGQTEGIYEWYTAANGGELVFTGAKITTPALLTTTTYYVQKRIESCVSPRTAVTVTVTPVIDNNTIAAAQTICFGSKAETITGSAPTGGTGTYTYTWQSSTNNVSFSDIQTNSHSKDFTPENLTQDTWFRRVVKSGSCDEHISEAILIKVLPVLTNNTISADQVICEGKPAATLSGSSPVGGNGIYTFVWESSQDNITFSPAAGTNNQAAYTPGLLTKTTWFRRTVTSGPCAQLVSNLIKITVQPMPAAPVVTAKTICVNSATQLVATVNGTTTFNWYSTETGTTALATGASFTTPALTKTTTYYVESSSSNGCVNPQRTAVTVTVLPEITNNTISSSQQICSGEVANTLSGTNPVGGAGVYTYLWESSQDGVSFTPATGNNQSLTYQPGAVTHSTFFRRKVVSQDCFNYSNTIEIKVLPAITNNIIAGHQTLCLDVVPNILTGSTPTGGNETYTYLWEVSTAGATEGFAPAPGANAEKDYSPGYLTKTTWFRRIVSSSTCTSNKSEVIQIIVTPAISNNNISREQIICAGARPAALSGTLPVGGSEKYMYQWEYSTDNVTFLPAPGTNNGQNYQPNALTETTWFRRKVSAAACQVSTSDAVKITVTPAISNNILSKDQELCVGTTATTLTGSNPTGGNGIFTYLWESSTSGPASGFAAAAGINNTADYAPGLLSQTTWFRRTVLSGPCQANVSEVVKVTMNANIIGNLIASDQYIKAGSTPAPLSGVVPKGGNGTYTYAWESSTDHVNFAPAVGTNNLQNYAPPALLKTTWFRRIVTSGGCSNISSTVEITINPLVSENTIEGEQSICINNQPGVLTGSKPTGGDGTYNFIWESSTVSATGGFMTAAGDVTGQNHQPGALKQTTWFRRKVTSGGNVSYSQVIKVTVAGQITNNIISGEQTICAGSIPSLIKGMTANGGNASLVYLWESSTDGRNYVTVPGINNHADYAPGALYKTTWFRRTASAPGCNSIVSDPVKVTVNPTPVVQVAAQGPICPNTNTVLVAQSGNPAINSAELKYEWFTAATGGTPIFTGSNFTTPVLNTEKTYYVQASLQGCTSARVAVKVNVKESTANAGQDVTITPDKFAELQATGGVTYSWFPAEGLSNPSIANPVATPKTTTTYKVTVTTAEGCVTTDEVTVTVLPTITVYNGFTPNGDGLNDTWEIPNIEMYPNCQVQIFNRWGNNVFTSTGYKQPWDGRLNGKDLPVATYYYTINLNNGEKPISGSVTIIK